ncbi:MAG: ATP synthase F0 subunit B [Nitrospiraceae bacterium]|nr:ATP synthase F0 subunit B [Nitrospiraceae bacterium]
MKSKINIRNFIFITFCFFTLLTAGLAFASGGETEHTPLWKEYLWKVINFSILVALLVLLIKKADIKGSLKNRTELIERTLREAKEAKELAEKSLAEVEKRYRTKDKEIEEIISSAKKHGEEEKIKIIEEIKHLREKILEQTKVNIEYELREAKAAIKAEAVDIAMELAGKKLKDKISSKELSAFLEESIKEIEDKK